MVSCLASRTGGRQDSWAIDHQATLNTYREDRLRRPLRAAFGDLRAETAAGIQKAKLAFEAELQADGEMTHSIVRPQLFQSLGGQVKSCRKGGLCDVRRWRAGQLQADQRSRSGQVHG